MSNELNAFELSDAELARVQGGNWADMLNSLRNAVKAAAAAVAADRLAATIKKIADRLHFHL